MSMKIFVLKYIAQLKALNPKYDKVFELESEKNPVIYQDRENLRLSFAAIADTHLPNRESAALNLNNLILDQFNSWRFAPIHEPSAQFMMRSINS